MGFIVMTSVFGMTTVDIRIRLMLHSQTCDRYNFNAVQCTLKPVSEVTLRAIQRHKQKFFTFANCYSIRLRFRRSATTESKTNRRNPVGLLVLRGLPGILESVLTGKQLFWTSRLS